MNTSDVVSAGSRPLLPTDNSNYRREPKDILYARLLASTQAIPSSVPTGYDSSLYEFPGDRTSARYGARGGA